MKWFNTRNTRLLWVLISQDIRGRYVGSTLGIFWNIINPLILLGLYTLIFQVIMNLPCPDHPSYAAFIFCGLLPWMAISESLIRSSSTIIQNANLVQKVVFPKEVLVLYVVASSLFHELIGIGLLLVFLVIVGTPPGITVLFLILVFAIQLVFCSGLGFLFSTLNVFIRDTVPLLQAFLPVWFFLTPIVYHKSLIAAHSDKALKLLMINPLYLVVEMYRSILLRNEAPDMLHVGIFCLFALVALVVGIKYFQKNKRVFSDYI